MPKEYAGDISYFRMLELIRQICRRYRIILKMLECVHSRSMQEISVILELICHRC